MTGTAQEFPLKASSVRLGYDRKIVIEDITLEVPEGELTMLIGPNGCGKSTLLKALARVLAPKAGYVYLGGNRHPPAADHRRRPQARVPAAAPVGAAGHQGTGHGESGTVRPSKVLVQVVAGG